MVRLIQLHYPMCWGETNLMSLRFEKKNVFFRLNQHVTEVVEILPEHA